MKRNKKLLVAQWSSKGKRFRVWCSWLEWSFHVISNLSVKQTSLNALLITRTSYFSTTLTVLCYYSYCCHETTMQLQPLLCPMARTNTQIKDIPTLEPAKDGLFKFLVPGQENFLTGHLMLGHYMANVGKDKGPSSFCFKHENLETGILTLLVK